MSFAKLRLIRAPKKVAAVVQADGPCVDARCVYQSKGNYTLAVATSSSGTLVWQLCRLGETVVVPFRQGMFIPAQGTPQWGAFAYRQGTSWLIVTGPDRYTRRQFVAWIRRSVRVYVTSRRALRLRDLQLAMVETIDRALLG